MKCTFCRVSPWKTGSSKHLTELGSVHCPWRGVKRSRLSVSTDVFCLCTPMARIRKQEASQFCSPPGWRGAPRQWRQRAQQSTHRQFCLPTHSCSNFEALQPGVVYGGVHLSTVETFHVWSASNWSSTYSLTLCFCISLAVYVKIWIFLLPW